MDRRHAGGQDRRGGRDRLGPGGRGVRPRTAVPRPVGGPAHRARDGLPDVARGFQQVAAAVLGVLLAFAAGSVFGVNAASLGAMLLIAMLAGTTRALRAESTRPPRPRSSCS